MRIHVRHYVKTTIVMHTWLHRRCAEHTHDPGDPTRVMVTVSFSEDLAKQLFEQIGDHEYRWDADITLPDGAVMNAAYYAEVCVRDDRICVEE